jgi:hypothetical protein
MKQKLSALALLFVAAATLGSCIRIVSPSDSTSKLAELMHLIGGQYVDTVDMDELVEKTIPKVLAELDPTRCTSLHAMSKRWSRTYAAALAASAYSL